MATPGVRPVSQPTTLPARSPIDKDKLLEPYRADVSNAFAATEPARLEDMPGHRPPSSGRGG